MRRILFTSLMLAACAGAAAQNVGEDEAIIDPKRSELTPIPSEYTKEGKVLLVNKVVTNYDTYSSIFKIYNDNLEHINEFKPELAEERRYTIVKEREAEVHELGYVTYTGDWTEERTSDHTSHCSMSTYITDFDGTWEYANIQLTQTLFNDDDEYEYIIPETSIIRDRQIEEDRDGDGEIDRITEDYDTHYTGFSIKSSNGQIMQTINIENGYYVDNALQLLQINEKTYLKAYVYPLEEQYGSYYIYYPIKPNSTGINPLGAPMKMKVSPRMADRSESFTVELDGDSSAEREVVVVNSAGQTVWKRKVPAGQRTVTIGAARLGKGVNVVRVNGGKGAESCKVIVK